MLEVTSLTRAYGSHLAIADVTLRVADGELVTIVGPSGCGKSTLLRCVAGLLAPTSGQVVLNGAPVTRVPGRLAVVFQDYSRSLYPWLSVAANVALPLLRYSGGTTPRNPADASRRGGIMTTTHHAEHVGSLLRPQWLLEAREARGKGLLSTQELRELEDRAILEHIALQHDAGLTVFTDGEARRDSWRAGFLESLGGVVPAARTMTWYRDDGPLPPEETPSDGVAAAGKVTRKQDLTGVEAAFMAARAPGAFKITMISASMGGMIWHPRISAAVYPAQASLIEDLAALQLAEIEGLIARGVRWIQLDSLAYNRVLDPGKDDNVRGGLSPERLLDATVTVDARVVGAVKRDHPGVTVGLHICRGNFRSAWGGQGSYEPVAERLFNEVPVDRFLLEYDTERAGGFEPLRFVPGAPAGSPGRPGPTVVLGLVSTKVPLLEDPDERCRRTDEAARYVPLENLALSPQCGFASGSAGNLITVDDERRKLDLVVSVARRVWG